MSVDLGIVIVNWNVASLLKECLISIYETPEVHCDERGVWHLNEHALEVWVVDNGSTDGSQEMVRAAFPQVCLLEPETNLGFGRANNLVMEKSQADYLLFLNPDTLLVGHALSAMLGYMINHPLVGMLGPQLQYANGAIQPSRRRFPTVGVALMESTLLEQWFPDNRWARSYRVVDKSDADIQQVDWVTGACMLVRHEVWHQVGGFDERYFLYSEELDWCRRIVGAGWQIVYFPQAIVVHYEGQSSGQVMPERHVRFHTSKILYFQTYHGVGAACLLRIFLLATYVWQLAEETLKYLLGHKRALRRERMSAYVRVLRSRLRSVAGPMH